MEDIKPNVHQLSTSPPESSTPNFPRQSQTSASTGQVVLLPGDERPHLPSISPTIPIKSPPLFSSAHDASSKPSAGLSDMGSQEIIKTLAWPHPGPSNRLTSQPLTAQSTVLRIPQPPRLPPTITPTSSPSLNRGPRWTTATTPARSSFGPSSSQPSLFSAPQPTASSQPLAQPPKAQPLQRSRTAPQGLVPENQTPHNSRSISPSQPVPSRPHATDFPPAKGSTQSPASTYVTADGSQGSRKLSVSPLVLSGQSLPPASTLPVVSRASALASPQVRIGQHSTPPAAPPSSSPTSSNTAPAASSTAAILALARARLQQSIPAPAIAVPDVDMAEVENEVFPGESTSNEVPTGAESSDVAVDGDIASRSSSGLGRPGENRTDSSMDKTNKADKGDKGDGLSQPATPQIRSAQRGGAVVAEITKCLASLHVKLADLKAKVKVLPTHDDLHHVQTSIGAQISRYQTTLAAWQVGNGRLNADYTTKLDTLPGRTELLALEKRLMASLVPRGGLESMRSDLKGQMVGLRVDVDNWRNQSKNDAKAKYEQMTNDRDAQQSDHATLLSRLDKLEQSLAALPSTEIYNTLSEHSTSLLNFDSRLAALSSQIAALDNDQTRAQNRETLLAALQPVMDKQLELASTQEALTMTIDEIRRSIPPAIDVQDEVEKGLQAFFSQFDGPSVSPVKGSSFKTFSATRLRTITPKEQDYDLETRLKTPLDPVDRIDRLKLIIKAPLLSTFAEDDEDDVPGADGPLFDESLGPDITDNFPPLSDISEGYEQGVDPNAFKWQHSFLDRGGDGTNGDSQSSRQSGPVSKGGLEPGAGLNVSVPFDEPVQDWEMGRVEQSEGSNGDNNGEDGKAAPSRFDAPDSRHDALDRPAFPSVQSVHPPTPPPDINSPVQATAQVPSQSAKTDSTPPTSRHFPSRSRSVTARLDPSPSIRPKSKRASSVMTQDFKDSKSGAGSKRRKTGPRAESDPKKLAKSDGKPRGAGKWPRWGPNSGLGMWNQTIECEICHGLAHWACAGFKDDDPSPDGDWMCPDCVVELAADTAREDVERAPQDRCIRGACIRRQNQKIKLDMTGGKIYLVDRIIGRKAISRNPDESRNFQNLVLWQGYPLKDSTWEPDAHLGPHRDSLLAAYNSERENQGLDSKPRVVLLVEATECFDEKGEKR